jgi:1,4-dihydroxy-6-naphthoate synthase
MQFGRGIDADTADQFVGMYVNALTLEMGERGRRAIEEFLRRGAEVGIVPQASIHYCPTG